MLQEGVALGLWEVTRGGFAIKETRKELSATENQVLAKAKEAGLPLTLTALSVARRQKAWCTS